MHHIHCRAPSTSMACFVQLACRTRVKSTSAVYVSWCRSFSHYAPAHYNRRDDTQQLLKDAVIKKSVPESSTTTSVIDETGGFAYPSSRRERDLSKKVTKSVQPLFDPDKSSVLLFPGQGTQFVGMGKTLIELPRVREIYAIASEILGYDLLHKCLHGPQTELNQTVFCQPAVFVTSLAALERLKLLHPEAIDQCIATAGFSVGEYAALVFAGMLDFEDALRLLMVRAKVMQDCSELASSGLLTVALRARSKLSVAIQEAKNHVSHTLQSENVVCCVAIDLFTNSKVIGGHTECLEWLEQNGAKFDVRPLKRVRVSGAFHTSLMAAASSKLKYELKTVKFHVPKLPVIANATGTMYPSANSDDKLNLPEIHFRLYKQVSRPVRWEQTMHSLFNQSRQYFMDRGIPRVYEMGPGRQLLTIMHKFAIGIAITRIYK